MGHHKRKKSKHVRAGKKKRPWKLGAVDYDGNCRRCKTSDAKRMDATTHALALYERGEVEESPYSPVNDEGWQRRSYLPGTAWKTKRRTQPKE